MITQCCIHELYLKGKEAQSAVDLAKTFERRRCNHREAIPGDECLLSVVGESSTSLRCSQSETYSYVGDSNKHRYVIASQSTPLRQQLRQIAAVPLVHVNRSVMILEPPSNATLAQKEKVSLRALSICCNAYSFFRRKNLVNMRMSLRHNLSPTLSQGPAHRLRRHNLSLVRYNEIGEVRRARILLQ